MFRLHTPEVIVVDLFNHINAEPVGSPESVSEIVETHDSSPYAFYELKKKRRPPIPSLCRRLRVKGISRRLVGWYG